MQPIHFEQTRGAAAAILGFIGFLVLLIGLVWYIGQP